jgi:hypothetical protein
MAVPAGYDEVVSKKPPQEEQNMNQNPAAEAAAKFFEASQSADPGWVDDVRDQAMQDVEDALGRQFTNDEFDQYMEMTS